VDCCLSSECVCCVEDLVRLLDSSQCIESVDLASKVVEMLIDLASSNPLSTPQWDGRIDATV